MNRISSYTLIAASTLVLLGLVGVWVYAGQQLFAIREAAQLSHADLLAAEEGVIKSEQMRSALRASASERATLDTYTMYSAPEVVALVREAASAAGVPLSITAAATSNDTVAGARDVPLLSLDIAATDSYARIEHFLSLLQTAPLVLSIQSLSLQHEDTLWALHAKLSIYSNKLE